MSFERHFRAFGGDPLTASLLSQIPSFSRETSAHRNSVSDAIRAEGLRRSGQALHEFFLIHHRMKLDRTACYEQGFRKFRYVRTFSEIKNKQAAPHAAVGKPVRGLRLHGFHQGA